MSQVNACSTRMLRWLIVIVALTYVWITPPFQAPDETLHFFKAYAVSVGGVISVSDEGSLGYHLPVAIANLAEIQFPPNPYTTQAMRYDPRAILAAWAEGSDLKATKFVPFPNMAPYSPTMYLPQAAGIWIGRQIGLSPIGMFYAGRLTNTVTAILLTLAAVRLLPLGATALLAVACLPATLAQFGSLSADANIISLTFLVIALATRGSIDLAAMRRGEGGRLLVSIVLLVLAKGVYWPVACAGLVTRDFRFSARQWWILVSICVGVAFFVVWLMFGRGADIQFSIISRRTLERTMTAQPADQLAQILAAPSTFIAILISSFAERLPVYVIQVIGRFGWNTVLLPLPLYGLGLLLLGTALIAPSESAPRPTRWQRLWWLLLAIGMVVMIETALYLTGTPLGADYIQGTQGRYFLPFLPLVLLALSCPLQDNSAVGAIARFAFPSMALILNISAMAVVIDAFWISGVVRGTGF